MKKLMMIAAMMVAAISANAQAYIGGSVGFLTTSYAGESTTSWSILPEFGYNLNENWAVGMLIGYGESGSDDDKVKTLQVSPYARYTAVKLNKVNVFLDGGVAYANTDYAGAKLNTFEVGIKPGVAVNLDEKLSFVAHFGFLGYDYSKAKGADEGASSFGFNLDSNVSFGLYLNF